MSGNHSNFIPNLFIEELIAERDDVIVAAKLCNRDYEGQIKQKGDKVKVSGVSRPTIIDYDDINGLGDFERLQDQSTMLEITQAKAFHYFNGKIEKTQSASNYEVQERAEAAAALAMVMDSYIYTEIMKTKAAALPVVESLGKTNVLDVLAKGLSNLWKNNVPRNETVSLECTPNLWAKLVMANLIYDTDNSQIIKNGVRGTLRNLNINCEMSNNIPVFDTTGEYAILRTKKAVTFAEQITEVKEYEPEKYFGTAVKGLQVYGAKVIRPKELAIIPIKAYSEDI